ncbi:MAG: MBL fold metallo-hydrolase [Thermoplasmata archaeon]|nr:MAG: MBL fold metallo-hydrolase [Thermoplasmata archaeon]
MEYDIDIRFLGGSNKVGSLGMLFEKNNQKLLFDYGMTPSKPPEIPLPAPPVDTIFLSHAHLDHSGMIPALCEEGNTPIYTTALSSEIAQLLHKDSLKIAKLEGYAPPFTNSDICSSSNQYVDVKPKDRHEIGDITAHFHDAGHIPGSLMIEVVGSSKFLFTGDFNTVDTHLVKATKPVDCDILCMEGTYAGREHPKKRDELEKEFCDRIEEVHMRGGIVILPAFAVSRSQELIMVLRKKGFNIWFDGMGRKVAKMYLQHKEFINESKELKKALNKINFVHSDHGRKLALNADVIITSSGMMDGGPVLHYMNKVKNDSKSAVFLTGYQVEETNSRLLMDKGKLDFYGVVEDVSCEKDYFDFSGHAGHSELIEFAKGCNPEKIILMHSDKREVLAESLSDVAEVIMPSTGQQFNL